MQDLFVRRTLAGMSVYLDEEGIVDWSEVVTKWL